MEGWYFLSEKDYKTVCIVVSNIGRLTPLFLIYISKIQYLILSSCIKGILKKKRKHPIPLAYHISTKLLYTSLISLVYKKSHNVFNIQMKMACVHITTDEKFIFL